MQEIQAHSKSINDLLNKKYAVDFYQREYKWGKKQIDDLVDDLTAAFDENWHESHQQPDVEGYEQYFLGPIIVDASDGKRHIVDGQQRLTTLTLALICLLHSTKSESQQGQLQNLIYSAPFGTESFNLDVPERTNCMLHLLRGRDEEFNVDGEPESVRNLIARHQQMQMRLTDSLENENRTLLFITWLVQKVYLVEIVAPSGKEAYRIFETMNDRGLRLAPAEMLKGYLLSEIREKDARTKANESWKKQVDELSNRKDEDADAIKAWLRARHATKLADFEIIGAQFHRWVRDNSENIGLKNSSDFAQFITRDFEFYAGWYMRVRNAAEKYGAECGLERIHYLKQHNFTLQYPLLLAPLVPGEAKTEINRKLRVIAAYLDILVHRRIGHGESIAESMMRPQIFGLIPAIRAKNVQEITAHLTELLQNGEHKETFAHDFALHQQNGPRIHRILARITDYMHTESNDSSSYEKFFAAGKKSFQIEHIWHANYEDVCSEECMKSDELSEIEFNRMRNYIGGLLLLPSIDNASYGKIPYAEKLIYYGDVGANLLSASLHKGYHGKHKPGFRQFKDRSGLPFEPHAQFRKTDLEKRQALYRQIADKIWHPKILREEAESSCPSNA